MGVTSREKLKILRPSTLSWSFGLLGTAPVGVRDEKTVASSRSSSTDLTYPRYSGLLVLHEATVLYGRKVAGPAGILGGPDPKCGREFQSSAGTCFQDLGNAFKITRFRDESKTCRYGSNASRAKPHHLQPLHSRLIVTFDRYGSCRSPR